MSGPVPAESERPHRPPRAPGVTVVIATHGRRDELDHTLTELEALPERPEVVVVDNASPDDLPDLIARRHPMVRLVKLHENRGAAGRNVGAEVATTPLVAFCDDDSWWTAGSIATAAAAFEERDDLGLVTARVLVGPDERIDVACVEMEASPLESDDAPGVSVIGFIAGACMVRRQAFLHCGGFDRRYLIGGEEELLALDLMGAGWQISYLAAATVRHRPSKRRDRGERARLLVRNRLWTAWLRRPGWSAIRRSGRILREAGFGRELLGVVDAAGQLGWVLRERRVVPEGVERLVRTVESAATRDPPDGELL